MLRAENDAPARSGRARDCERDERARRRRVLDVAVQPGRKPEQLGEPVERQLLELLERGRRAPEDPDLVQARGEQLRQDRGLGARRREVREEARALPVRPTRAEHAVEIGEHGRERLRTFGRCLGKRRADRPRLDLRQHGGLAHALEVGRDPVDGERAVVAERAHFRSLAISRQGRVFRICSFVSHARRACAMPSSA